MAEMAGNNTLDPLIHAYLGGRLRRGEIQAITMRGHRASLLRFSEVHGRRPLDKLGRATVDRWLELIGDQAPGTRSTRISVVRGFCRWLVLEGKIRRDPTIDMPKIRRPRQVRRTITLEQFVAMLDACADERERVVIWLMYGMGMRAVEVARLQVGDWDRRRELVKATGKGGHERTVPVFPPAAAVMSRYLATVGWTAGSFVRRLDAPSQPVTPSRISHVVRDVMLRAGVKERARDGISGHSLRASSAVELLEACGDVRVVQRFLGHANLATTHVYLGELRDEDLQAAVRQRRWNVDGEAA